MSKVLSVRVDDATVEWLDDYAGQRGVSRAQLLEHAIAGFVEDCASGVPELRELRRRVRAAQAPRPGECSCPVLPPDGARGFSAKCPAHGGRSRQDFANFGADRSAMFRSVAMPESSKYGPPKGSS